MWEAQPEDLFFIDTNDFFYYTDDQASPQQISLTPRPQSPRKQSTQLSKRTNQIYIRKIKRLQRKIKDLESQLEKANNNRKLECCPSDVLEIAKGTQIDPSQAYYLNTQLGCQEQTPYPEYLQFEQFEIIKEQKPCPQKETELNGQNWILMGMMMLVMGININGFDSTSLDVYKLTKESISSIRQQVQNCSQEIVLPIFYSRLFSDISNNETVTALPNGSFQMQGVKIQSIQQDNLMFQEHISLKLKYQALLLIADYLKQYVSLA